MYLSESSLISTLRSIVVRTILTAEGSNQSVGNFLEDSRIDERFGTMDTEFKEIPTATKAGAQVSCPCEDDAGQDRSRDAIERKTRERNRLETEMQLVPSETRIEFIERTVANSIPFVPSKSLYFRFFQLFITPIFFYFCNLRWNMRKQIKLQRKRFRRKIWKNVEGGVYTF